jgi:hypothetical protein
MDWKYEYHPHSYNPFWMRLTKFHGDNSLWQEMCKWLLDNEIINFMNIHGSPVIRFVHEEDCVKFALRWS